jgi:hypothetical protein
MLSYRPAYRQSYHTDSDRLDLLPRISERGVGRYTEAPVNAMRIGNMNGWKVKENTC